MCAEDHRHANKGSRRYRYYVEAQSDPDVPTARLPARDIENTVVTAVVAFLRDHRTLLSKLGDIERAEIRHVTERATSLAEQVTAASSSAVTKALRPILRRVTYREDALQIELSGIEVRGALGISPTTTDAAGANFRSTDIEDIVLTAPLTVRRRGRQLKLLLDGEMQPTNVDRSLVTAISRAHHWAQQLVTGQATSITQIARQEGVSPTYVGQMLPLGFLAPSVVEAILSGRQPPTLTADRLIWRERVALLWDDQSRAVGENPLGVSGYPLAELGLDIDV